MNRTRACWENQDRVMDVDEVIARVETICRANGVKKLKFLGMDARFRKKKIGNMTYSWHVWCAIISLLFTIRGR